MTEIKITTQAEGPRVFRSGIPAMEVLPARDGNGDPFICCFVNNEAVSLDTRLTYSCVLEGASARHAEGIRVLRRSTCFLLAMAVRRAAPAAQFHIQHSLGDGFFFTLRAPSASSSAEPGDDAALLAEVEREMRAIAAADLPIETSRCAYDEALEHFASAGQSDKLGLLRHINTPAVRIARCAEFAELLQGPLAPRTGLLGVFAFIPCGNGCILQLPSQAAPAAVAEFAPRPALMREHSEHAEWGEKIGLETVADLNASVESLEIYELIQLCEALHARNFAKVADDIAARPSPPRLVLIAGPSSAGKTTSAKRLSLNLRNNGYRPIVVSTDDYFVGDEGNPIGEDGKPDYEHINALDLDAFNTQLEALLAGRAVKRRIFDFKTKKPVILNETLALGDDDILIVEGIHGLNPMLTQAVPRGGKFLIFLSALTQLGIDSNNVLSTSDNRLVRRLVRDHLFRSHPAIRTLGMWQSVRRGEERWIFPFQDDADASFNTALDYELAVLRPFAEPLLAQVKPRDPEYATARRIERMLSNFHAITPAAVPPDSILREYIGGSVFQY